MLIKDRHINIDNPPFIIAEMSGNHNNSLDRALKIVKEAHNCGADAIKLQTFIPETITLDSEKKDFLVSNKNSPWYGSKLIDLYRDAVTPWEWHKPIFDYAAELGIICFSSVFDEKAVDFLEELNTPCYKIASFENNHLPLIKKVAETGKPLIISTGMATISEIERAVKVVEDSGNKDFALLKCTSNYPASSRSSNLNTIPHMRKLFKCEIGLSDHTLGIGTAIASVVKSASIIEKHFTLSRADKGVDSSFSAEPLEMKLLVNETKNAWVSLGDVNYQPGKEELDNLVFRRSIYVVKDIKKGESFSKENISIIRPGYGISPHHYEQIVGKVSHHDLERGTAFKLEFIG